MPKPHRRKKKMSKRAIEKGHEIAKAIKRQGGGGARNAYAVGTAAAKKLYR